MKVARVHPKNPLEVWVVGTVALVLAIAVAWAACHRPDPRAEKMARIKQALDIEQAHLSRTKEDLAEWDKLNDSLRADIKSLEAENSP